MKKNSFIEGTIIATLAIVITKILGMIYVIPFCAIIGAQGKALYGYAYNIYSLFLEISTAGVPNAVSKIVNEFNTLNRQEAKIRTYKLGKRILCVIAVITFIALFLLAPLIGKIIIADMSGGNTPEDVAFVIRCVSFAILVFPFLSVSRGFFQGHNIIYVSSFSQVIEQLARVTVIIGGSYIALNCLHLSLTHAVGVAVFGAFVGGAFALLYVYRKLFKYKTELYLDKDFKEKDAITNKEIIKKIIKYAIPVIVISIAFTIYNNVDMLFLLRTMEHLGFATADVEFIATGISTWAVKICIIITSVGLGLSSSLIPAMVEAYTLKNYKDVNRKFNKAMEIIIFISVPMCVGISMLSAPIWRIFYAYDNYKLGASILSVCIFAPLFTNLFTVANYTLQSVNKFKMVYIAAITGIALNIILDVPCMLLLNMFNVPAYYGVTLATVIGLSTTVIIAMFFLRKEYDFKYQEIFRVMKKSIIPLVIMIMGVLILKNILNVNYGSRLSCIIYVAIISIVGAVIYFFIAYKLKLIDEVLGKEFISKIKSRFKIKKRS
ncbi:MAG: polysaccharide biosynthesis protein [Ruminococcus sp.]|nr:polysaccharide biosynthesis protein [Ruminococcus sp.]